MINAGKHRRMRTRFISVLQLALFDGASALGLSSERLTEIGSATCSRKDGRELRSARRELSMTGWMSVKVCAGTVVNLTFG